VFRTGGLRKPKEFIFTTFNEDNRGLRLAQISPKSKGFKILKDSSPILKWTRSYHNFGWGVGGLFSFETRLRGWAAYRIR
jgi:hypothetical protein